MAAGSSCSSGTQLDKRGACLKHTHSALICSVMQVPFHGMKLLWNVLGTNVLSQAPMYYRRANAAMIVYDITSEKSFEEAQTWAKGITHLSHFIQVHCRHNSVLYSPFRVGEQGGLQAR